MEQKSYRYIDENGSFELENAENDLGLYFPISGDGGLKSSITPNLGGDSKLDQNHFLLEPVSIENLYNNRTGRNFWCLVEEEEPWSAVGSSARQEADRFTDQQEESLVRAGRMWHETERRNQKLGLRSRVTSFVAISGNAEIMEVSITNDSDHSVSLTAVAAIPVYGRSADNIRDHRHVTSLLHRTSLSKYGVHVTPTLSFDERGHQVNDTTYFVEGVDGDQNPPVRFYPELSSFVGKGGTFLRPEAIYRRNKVGEIGISAEEAAGEKHRIPQGQEALGGLEFARRELKAGESLRFTMILGAVPSKNLEDISRIRANCFTENGVKEQLQQVKNYWNQKIDVKYHTGDPAFDQFMNWISFQPELRKIYGCSFLPHHDYGKGGRGWRDLWQDCLALLLMNPSAVRSLLVSNFGGVRVDGSNATIIGTNPGEFKADRNAITRVWSDHGIWPLITTKLYLDQTGDFNLLYESVTYFKDRQVKRGRDTDSLWTGEHNHQTDVQETVVEGTILEHLLLQNLTSFYEVGDHNNLQLRDADWNDALDMARDKGETVAFTCALAMNLSSLAEILEHEKERGRTSVELLKEILLLLPEEIDEGKTENNTNAASVTPKRKREILEQYLISCSHHVSGEKVDVEVETLIQMLKSMSSSIKKHVSKQEFISDKEGRSWFNSYYDNHGNAVESNGRMMLTGQVFAIMSGAANTEQIRAVASAADHYLYDEACGGYRLNTDFGEVRTDLGRMFGFAYGEKENGAVFSHMAVMYAYALYHQGFGKEGHKSLDTLYRQAVNFPVSRIYPGIPEYFNNEGRGLYHYLTGAASWYMLTVITEMFGVRGREGDLEIMPQLRKDQFDEKREAVLSFTFADRKMDIRFINEESLDCGDYRVDTILVNGEKAEIFENGRIPREDLLKLEKDSRHEIKVYLRSKQ